MGEGPSEEFQRRNIEQYGESQQRGWHSTVEFWKHLAMVEATVIGWTVGLIGAGGQGVPKPLVIAWVALLLGIFLACVLIRAGIERSGRNKRMGFQTAHELAEVRRRVEAGELRVEPEEYQGLVVAAVMQSPPEWERKKAFSAKALEETARWSDKLPYGRFLKQGHMRLYKRLERHLVRVEVTFYLLSSAAFVLMIAIVLTAEPRPAHASVGASARQVAPAVSSSEAKRTPAAPDSSNASRAQSGPPRAAARAVRRSPAAPPAVEVRIPDSMRVSLQGVREPVPIALPEIATRTTRDAFDWTGLIVALLGTVILAPLAALLAAWYGANEAGRAERRNREEERLRIEAGQRELLLRRLRRDVWTLDGIERALRRTAAIGPLMPATSDQLQAMWDGFNQQRSFLVLIDEDLANEIESFYHYLLSLRGWFGTWLENERPFTSSANASMLTHEVASRAAAAELVVGQHVTRGRGLVTRLEAVVHPGRAPEPSRGPSAAYADRPRTGTVTGVQDGLVRFRPEGDEVAVPNPAHERLRRGDRITVHVNDPTHAHPGVHVVKEESADDAAEIEQGRQQQLLDAVDAVYAELRARNEEPTGALQTLIRMASVHRSSIREDRENRAARREGA